MAITNSCRFIGRITKNLEATPLNSGKTMVKMSLAVQRDFKNAFGEYETDFISFVAFNSNADYLLKYAEKGDDIIIESTCRPRSYENKEGKTITVIEFLVDSVKIFKRKTGVNVSKTTESNPEITALDTYNTKEPSVSTMEKYPNGIICAESEAELPF